MKFVHLHTHSHYSLLDGLSKVDELVSRAKELGMEAIALTDHGNLYGAVEFYKKAKKAGIKPILGCEFYFAPNGRTSRRPKIDETRYHLPLLVKNETGWKNILKLATKSHLEGFYYKPRIDRELLQGYHEGLICLSGCFSGEIPKLLFNKRDDEAEEAARFYRDLFGEDFYLELQPHAPEVHSGLKALSQKLGIPLVATQDAHYIFKDDKTAHEILLAIQTNTKLDDEKRFSLEGYAVHLRTAEEMLEHFSDVPEALANTIKIAEKCNFQLELGRTRLPKFETPDGESAIDYLKKLVHEKAEARLKEITETIQDRLAMELGVIEKTGFADYFLIVQDFIRWARIHGIVVGPGRGSAAGSLVSFVLGITNIDPLKYDLLFERFLNPERIQVPDIDIDFTDTRRDEVIAYVREKYGEERVAQIITFGTMMARAAVRDTGRALGIAYGFCDTIAKLLAFNLPLKESLETVAELKKMYDENPDAKRVLDAAIRLEGTVRHASVHACGVVISAEPLTDVLPLQRAPQGEETILTQFEMRSVDDLGLLKIDFLGLKTLTIIEKTLRLVKEIYGEKIDLESISLDDPGAFKLYQSGETTGVFQLESSGMRRYLKELKPTELEDIIAMISLYRPGPMELIPSYIARKHGREPVSYLHPKLEPILKNTYGVGVYQEQMMRIARDLAGFTLAEADILRKAIGKKIKDLLDEQKERLIKGMLANGIDAKTAEKIWELFPPFARYGFNRSHGACYAIISYQTAYLKAHYPVLFMASLLNTSGDTDRVTFLVSEARRLGINVLPPDINSSFEDFTMDTASEDKTKPIRFGLLAVKNIGVNIVKEIIAERLRGGPFADIADFLSRIRHRDLNKKSLESLVKCGAFDSFKIKRGELAGNIEELLRFNQAAKKIAESNQYNLFGASTLKSSLRLKPVEKVPAREILAWEKELLGLYVSDHPFNSYIEKARKFSRPISEIYEHPNGSEIQGLRLSGVITVIQKITTKKGDPMLFATIEDETGKIEILVFSRILAKSGVVWQEGKAILLSGKLSWRDEEPKVICEEVKEL